MHQVTGPISRTIGRRRFLRTCAGLATVPLLAPASILGRGEAVAPSNRINMATIGVGNRAMHILSHFLAFPQVQMRAMADCRADRLEKGRQAVNAHYHNEDCQGYHDFRELLARPDVDAVFIATGVRWHAVASLYAAKAGKDIYCEKPVSLTLAEGRTLADTCKRLGTVYQAGHQRRSVDSYRFMIEIARRGLIGRIKTVQMQVWEGPAVKPEPVVEIPAGFDYDMWLGQAPWRPFSWAHVNNFMFFYDFSDGVVTEMGCHYTDLMQFGLRTDHTGPVEFEGKAEFPDPKTYYSETPLRGEVRCKYSNGITGVMQQKGRFEDRFIRFVGEEGWIQVDDQTDQITAEPKSLLSLRRQFGNKGWADTGDHIGDFLRAIRTRGQTVAHVESAHRANSIGQIMSLCLRLGRPLRWDPSGERFVNDEDANRLRSRSVRAPWHL